MSMYMVDNAVIMAAGTSSRFAPLSYERPKALIEVRGEILIERQIRQLQDAGIWDIYIVVGYKSEQFDYLKEKFGVHIIRNEEYLLRNNHSSIYAARHVIRNTYICSADNYFPENPFEKYVEESYYAALYSQGHTKEWCMQTDDDGYINRVTIGGNDAWYMLGHSFWSENFSEKYLGLLNNVYTDPVTRNMFWEELFIAHLSELRMQVRQYADDQIFEFDSLDELREFDVSYISDTRSTILAHIAKLLCVAEADIREIKAFTGANAAADGFRFHIREMEYAYTYADNTIKEICK